MTAESAPAPAATAPPAAAAQLPRLVRFAVDSDDLGALFPADFVRTYADLVPDTAALDQLRARFPDSVIELIDRGLGDPAGAATIADIEPGALSPAEGADRIRSWHAEGRTDLTAYSDEANLPAVIAACQGLHYWHWIAAWGKLSVPSHPSAQVQFADANMLGFHADLTIVWNPAFRPAAAAAAAALAPPSPGTMAGPVTLNVDLLHRLVDLAGLLAGHMDLLAELAKLLP